MRSNHCIDYVEGESKRTGFTLLFPSRTGKGCSSSVVCVQQHSVNSAVFIFVKLQNVGASGLFELEAAAAAVMGKASITRHWEGLAVRKESVATAVALASLEE